MVAAVSAVQGAGVDVSDHALLRYLERVKGIDVEAARREVIAIAKVAASIGQEWAARDGHIYVIDGCWVTTVLPKGAALNEYRNDRQVRGPYGKTQRMRAGA